MLNIKILGTGCAKCEALEKKVKNVLTQNNITAHVEKVTDLKKIMNYGVLMTPGLVINEKVMSFGSIPPENQILEWVKQGN